MPAKSVLHRAVAVQATISESPIWEQKANTITSTYTQHNASVGGSILKEKSHLIRPHHIVDISLSRHLGVRLLLLQHSGKANRTPHCIPEDQ